MELRYRPPYNWPSMLAFLRARAIAGVEVIDGDRYFRTVEIDEAMGSIAVAHTPNRQSLTVSIRFPEARSLPSIVACVKRLFDLEADIELIEEHLSRDPVLAPLVVQRPGLRAPGAWDTFETAIRAVLGQQISVSAVRKLAGQLVALHGGIVPQPFVIHSALSHTFPTAARLASASSIGLAMPASRLSTLRAVAEASHADLNLFRSCGNIDETVAKLRAIRGVGEWTAQYIALRAAREMDAFPATDVGLLRSATAMEGEPVSVAKLLQRAERWRPWRAYAAQHLWARELIY